MNATLELKAKVNFLQAVEIKGEQVPDLGRHVDAVLASESLKNGGNNSSRVRNATWGNQGPSSREIWSGRAGGKKKCLQRVPYLTPGGASKKNACSNPGKNKKKGKFRKGKKSEDRAA